MKKLSSLSCNEKATIVTVSENCKIKRRLYDMGFVENAKVQCLTKGLRGSPIAFKICGAVVAIRKVDADNIGVIM